MGVSVGDLAIGLLMAVFGLTGLILASGALDDEMYVFGLSLVGFATLFVMGQIRRHYTGREVLGAVPAGIEEPRRHD